MLWFSFLYTVGCVILTPFVLLIVSFLILLAIVTTTFTSSFLFLRFALLAIEMISGLTLESTNWLLTHCTSRLKSYQTEKTPQKSIVMRRKKLSTSSLTLSQLPFKAKVKAKYSVSVPGTPDPELFHHRMTL